MATARLVCNYRKACLLSTASTSLNQASYKLFSESAGASWRISCGPPNPPLGDCTDGCWNCRKCCAFDSKASNEKLRDCDSSSSIGLSTLRKLTLQFRPSASSLPAQLSAGVALRSDLAKSGRTVELKTDGHAVGLQCLPITGADTEAKYCQPYSDSAAAFVDYMFQESIAQLLAASRTPWGLRAMSVAAYYCTALHQLRMAPRQPMSVRRHKIYLPQAMERLRQLVRVMQVFVRCAMVCISFLKSTLLRCHLFLKRFDRAVVFRLRAGPAPFE